MLFILYYLIGFIAVVLMNLAYRVVFLLYFHGQFSDLSFAQKLYALVWGLQYDAIAAAMLVAVVTILAYINLRFAKRIKVWSYLLTIPIVISVLLMSADIMYYVNSGRHIAYEIRGSINEFGSLVATAFDEHLFLMIAGIVFIIVFSLLVAKVVRRFIPHKKIGRSILSLELPLLILLPLSFLIIRGGPFRVVTIRPYSTYEIGNPMEASIAYNATYGSLYYLIKRKKLSIVSTPLPQLDKKTIKQALSALYPNKNLTLNIKNLKKMNIVVLMLESWPATLMKSYGYDKLTTPNFDRLRQKSFTTAGMIANGHRTSEGLFATFCSMQNPLGQSVAQDQLEFYPYKCLPQMLLQKGWDTAFFEATRKDLAGVGSLANKLGFLHTWGRSDIHRHQYPMNAWGYYDQDQYAFVLKKVSKMHEPFLVAVNTTTTHDYHLPPGIKSTFGMDTFLQRHLSVLHFADKALGEFLADYRQLRLSKPTLFIIEADHTAGLVNVSNAQQYFIPFVMFSSDGSIAPTKLNRMVSQRDIAPTIVDKLGGNVPWFTGKSMLDQSKPPYFADYYRNDILGWFAKDRLVEVNLSNNKMKCYLWKNNMSLQNQTPCNQVDAEHRKQAVAYSIMSQRLLFAGDTVPGWMKVFSR